MDKLINKNKTQDEKWQYYFNRGAAFERTKKWDLAEKDLKKALLLSPDNPVVLNYLGYSWVDRGIYYKQAFEYIKKAVQLAPDQGYIIDSLGWAYYKVSEYEKAIEYLEKATELQPEEAEINDHLGDAYWSVGRKREAKYQWKKALEQYTKEHYDKILVLKEKLKKGLSGKKGKQYNALSLSKQEN